MRPVSLAADAGESLLQPLVPAVRRQASVLERTGHRPWPVRRAPWLMAQTWDDLLFAHWRVPLERLRAVVPAKLPIDTFGGDAWLGVTPFVVRDLRLRGTPPLPALSTFAELNVRTYVTVDDKPGIWFLSLDASSAWAVQAARRSYRLPYFRAAIEPSATGEWIDYRSSRTAADGPAAEFEGRYQPASERFEAAPGSLERFLAERSTSRTARSSWGPPGPSTTGSWSAASWNPASG